MPVRKPKPPDPKLTPISIRGNYPLTGKELVTPTGLPLRGVSQYNDSQFGVMSAPGVRKPKGKVQKAIAPKRLNFWQRLDFRLRTKGLKTGITIGKTDDGLRYMFSVTSNAYADRENETITSKALQSYVTNGWQRDKWKDLQPYYWWHDKTLPPIGRVVWADMEGPFLIEVIKELPTKFAKKVWDGVEANPHIAFGTSHGFDYPEDKQLPDGTYTEIYKFETSLLPLDEAANPYTLSAILGSKDEMGNKKDDVLDRLTGVPGLASKLRKGVRGVDQELNRSGLQHKELKKPVKAASKGIAEEAGSKIDEIKGMLSDDPNLATEMLMYLISAIGNSGADSEPGGDEPMDEMQMDDDGMDDTEMAFDGGDDDETETKEQPGYEEPAKAGPQQSLVNNAITKQPGTFPKPVTQQEQTGTPPKPVGGKKSLESANDTAELMRVVKSMWATMKDVEAALGELADIPDRIATVEKSIDSQRMFMPSRASDSDETVVTDKKALARVKNLSADYDKFWGTSVENGV